VFDDGEFIRGTQVIYVPDHAEGNINHPDCERGIVTAHASYTEIFVRYFYANGDLRTIGNSECTDMGHLIIQDFMDVQAAQDVLFSLGYGVDLRPGYTCHRCGKWIGPPVEEVYCEECMEE